MRTLRRVIGPPPIFTMLPTFPPVRPLTLAKMVKERYKARSRGFGPREKLAGAQGVVE